MKPLTIEQLKSLEVGDWVWIEIFGDGKLKSEIKAYFEILGNTGEFIRSYHISLGSIVFSFDNYDTKWLAYKNKEQAEAKGEIVELPIKEELEQIVFHSCNREGIAKHCPQRITEAVYEYLKSLAEARRQELRSKK